MAVMRHKRLFIVIVGLIAIGGLLWAITSKHSPSHPPKTSTPISFSKKNNASNRPDQVAAQPAPSNETFANIIESDDNPNGISYTATSSSEPTMDWFVVRVVATNSYGSFDQVAILHRDPASSKLSIVADPDTSFSLSYLQSAGVPAAVQDQVTTNAN